MDHQPVSVVTGCSGFVGSHLVDYLIGQGHKVKCIVRKTSSLKWIDGKQIELFDSGLFDQNRLAEIVKDADYIFHVAGVVKSKTPEGYFRGNVTTTYNLLKAVVKAEVSLKRFVLVSSQTAAGPSKKGMVVNESMEAKPITTYGRSKAEAEEVAKMYKNEIPITIVRAAAVYGERDTEIFLVFKTFQKGLMTLVGFNKKQVSLIHVADLVRGIYLAAMSEKSVGETYFISSDKFYDWNSVADILENIFGKKAFRLKIPHPVVYLVAAASQFGAKFSSKAATFNLEKAKDFVQEAWTCDISKAKRDFGYQPEISLEDGLKRTIDWYKANNWL